MVLAGFGILLLLLGLSNYMMLTSDTFREAAVRKLPIGVKPLIPASGILKERESAEAAMREAILIREGAALRQQLAAMTRDALVLRQANKDLTVLQRTTSAKLAVAKERRLLGVTAARRLGSSMKARIGRSVARNIATLPGKVLPAVGATVVVGSTALELRDLCDSMRDISSLNEAVGLPHVDDRSVCGIRVGSVQAIVSNAKQNAGAAYASAIKALGLSPSSPPEQVPTPKP
jgi:hypothetical protein